MPDPFEEKKEELERRLREQPLAILVWGSGPGGGEHYDKRQQIRPEVAAHFTASAVRFSEELHDFTPGAEDVELPAQEEYQLATADVAVVLDTSAGPAAEVAYFARSPLKSKLIVFTHEQYKGGAGFPAKLR